MGLAESVRKPKLGEHTIPSFFAALIFPVTLSVTTAAARSVPPSARAFSIPGRNSRCRQARRRHSRKVKQEVIGTHNCESLF
jgi:hypothetical protein